MVYGMGLAKLGVGYVRRERGVEALLGFAVSVRARNEMRFARVWFKMRFSTLKARGRDGAGDMNVAELMFCR